MIDEEKFRRLKKQAEEAQTARDRAEGQLDAAMKRLSNEFGCKSIKEAEIMARKLEKEAERIINEFNKAVEDFEEKWSKRYDENAQGDVKDFFDNTTPRER